MNHSTHRPPHSRPDEDDGLDPSHLPVEPDDGTAPGGVTGEPDQDGTVDPVA